MAPIEYSFGTHPGKHPGETLVVGFEWFPLVAEFWKPGTEFALAAFVRPTIPTGFAYKRVINGGASGAREPAWPRSLGAVIEDGNGSWEAFDTASNAITTVAAPVVTADEPTELTVGSVSVVNGEGVSTRVNVVVSGGKDGRSYKLVNSVTVGTRLYVGTLLLPVSSRL